MDSAIVEPLKKALVKPLLFPFATTRTGSDWIPGKYSELEHVWIVNGEPIVHSKSPHASLTTKTEAQLERDDMSPSLAELQTKTAAQIERDDQDFNLLEMASKTDAVAERDD